MIEANNAQMALQQIHNIELKGILANKEKKKPTERKRLFPEGKGRLLTGDEFLADVKAQADAVQWRRIESSKRKVERVERAAQKEAEKQRKEREKREKRDAYDEAMVKWNEQCTLLKTQGVKRKDMPAKPRLQEWKKFNTAGVTEDDVFGSSDRAVEVPDEQFDEALDMISEGDESDDD